MATNLELLSDTLVNQMKSTAGAANQVVAELGTINGNMSLMCDSLGSAIPAGQYMVASYLLETGPTSTGSTTTSISVSGTTAEAEVEIEIDGNKGSASHSHAVPGMTGSETHSHSIPPAHHTLSAGDRVLVIWCGNDAVVTAIVQTS